MRVVILALAIGAPVMFAQVRGGARPAPARGGPVVAPARPGVPAVAVRPAGPVFAPVYVLGYYPNPYYYGAGYVDPSAYAAPAPTYAGPYAPPAPPPDPNAAPAYYGADPSGQGYPSILVNPNYTPQTASPVMRDYSYLPPTGDDAASQNSTPSVFFLIAMKDHTIYPAIAYWVENDTLNYVTQQGKRNQVPLGEVDRDFSTQLNKERNIDFALPTVTAN